MFSHIDNELWRFQMFSTSTKAKKMPSTVFFSLHVFFRDRTENRNRVGKNPTKSIFEFLSLCWKTNMSSETCAVCGPKRTSRAHCNCCKQYLCRDHLKEHDDLLNAQLEPLIDNANELFNWLKQFSIESLFEPIRMQLDQWKQSAFQSIERVYQEKTNDLTTHSSTGCNEWTYQHFNSNNLRDWKTNQRFTV
jgi:hypothetical protein